MAEGKAKAAANACAVHNWRAELAAMRDEIRAHTRYTADLLRQQAELRAELARLVADEG
jgi:hypothetical protein